MNDSSGREETITQSFEALVESINKLLTFHAEEADLVAHLEKAKALAQHALQLSANFLNNNRD